MTSISWNAEGGTNGVTVSTANSGGASGTAWDTVTIVASGTFVYDTTTFLSGAKSARLATGATSGTVLGQWAGALQAIWPSGLTTHTGRRYLRFAALPSANRTIVQLTDVTAATNRMNILLLTTGAIRLRNAASGTVVTTSTTLSVDTDYWISWRADGSTTGAYQLDVGLAGSSTPIESIVGGTANFGGTHGAAAFGWVSSAANLSNQWLDGVLVSDSSTVPGPEASGQTVAIGQTTETDTAQPLGRLKTLGAGQPSETDTALPMGRLKTAAVGLATESDQALPLGRLKVVPLGLATTTEVALPITALKTRALGLAVETDTALPLSGAKALAIGQATETDTALAMTTGGPQRDLTLRAGSPAPKWRGGAPRPKWRAGAPRT